MVDFSNVKQTVRSMVGLNFGSVKSSVHNMDNVYEQGKWHKANISNETSIETQEYLKNGKKVAETFYTTTKTQTAFSIYDHNTKRAYCTGWQDKKNTSDKFTRIDISHADGGYYSIVDSNGNGIVDENDTVTFPGKTEKREKTSIKLGDLLA